MDWNKAFTKAMAEAITEAQKPLLKRIADLERSNAEILAAVKAKNETYDTRERLITQAEARRRLGINDRAFTRIVCAGRIKMAATPNGREKVLESSLNSYIAGLQKEATA